MPRYINAEHFEESLDLMCDAGGILQPITEVVRQFCKDKIRLEPTADVQEVKHGRWIEKDSRYVHNFKCSVCNDVRFDIPTCMGKPLFNFCPNCGAKMDLEDGEEDEAD